MSLNIGKRQPAVVGIEEIRIELIRGFRDDVLGGLAIIDQVGITGACRTGSFGNGTLISLLLLVLNISQIILRLFVRIGVSNND